MIGMTKWLLAVLALGLVLGLATPLLADEERGDRGQQATGTVQGQVQQVDADQNQIVLKDQQGRERTFHVRRDAQVRLNGKDSRITDLRQGDQVTISYVRVAQDVRSPQRGQEGHAIRGQVQRIAADQNQLVVQDQEGKEWTFQVGRDAQVRVGDREQRLADLKQGDRVIVLYNREGDTLTAHAIRSRQRGQAAAEVARGQIQRVAADQNQLILKDQRGGQRAFQVSQDAQVHVAGKEGRLADLKQGDDVSVVYELRAREIRSERRND